MCRVSSLVHIHHCREIWVVMMVVVYLLTVVPQSGPVSPKTSYIASCVTSSLRVELLLVHVRMRRDC